MSNRVTIKELSENNVHFGHKTSKHHPDMTPYIWGKKNGIHLIDLAKTSFLLDYACKQLTDILSCGGQVLWVGTKKQAQKAILDAGAQTNQPYVKNRWIGGIITNYEQVKKAVARLLHMRDVVAKPLPHYKKKEIVMFKKEADRLDRNVGGIINLKGAPAIVVVVDAKRENTAIREANRSGIPVIALVDTNTSADMVDTVVPCNDDSSRSINLIVSKLSEAAKKGIEEFAKTDEGKKLAAAQEAAAKKKVDKEATKAAPVAKAPAKPAAKKATDKPDSDAKEAKKPVAKKAVAVKPAEKKATSTKTVEPKTVAKVEKKPAATKKVAKPTEEKAPTAKKVVKKPMAKKPAAKKTATTAAKKK